LTSIVLDGDTCELAHLIFRTNYTRNIDMTKQKAALFLFALAFVAFQAPANALNIDFGRHDRDHDGRWNRDEYDRANAYYYGHRHHNHTFETLDRNHDGYLDRNEVRRYYR